MEEKKELEVIDLRGIIKKLWNSKMLFVKTCSIGFVLSCLYIICIPRTYSTDLKLAPELANPMGGAGTLGSIAASLGFDFSEMQTSDAITPLLYPDLMQDNAFVTGLFNIPVKSEDGEIQTTYYDYLVKYQKRAWWKVPIAWVKKLFQPKEKKRMGGGTFDPYNLSRNQHDIAEGIRGRIKIATDKKTGVISISVTDQDALICKTIADSLAAHLQTLITDYRTNKARIDLEYYENLTEKALNDYEAASRRYASFADANMGVTLQSYRTKAEQLENDMQLKYNNYTAMSAQRQQALAKVQERTPAFSLFKGAAIPIKPTYPKRMIFVLAMTFLTFLGTAFYLVRDDLHLTF